MEKREIEVMWSYYFGISKVPTIWEKELKELHKSNVIRKIYEIIDNDFNEVWYLIRTNDEMSFILKPKCGNIYSKNIMECYKKNYDFFSIDTNVIKIFDDGIFPIVFKVSIGDFLKIYDESKNINRIFFNNYYCHFKNKYKSVRQYRNKVESETFNNELDAIYWCSDFSKTKKDILESNSRPINLKNRICEYELKINRKDDFFG